MPLRLAWTKTLQTQTDRVKCVDLHPVEPWVLSTLYSGKLLIHDWSNQALIKTIEVTQSALRCAKFIARQQLVVCAGDDLRIKAFNYNTMEKVADIEAHFDYIRCLAVHPTHSFLLSASDDMTVKLWDFSNGWRKVQTYENHAHYVMMVQWSPKDPQTFASASLDRSIKFWGAPVPGASASSAPQVVSSPHFTLLGHLRGVNCIDFSQNEQPYLISGGDDFAIRVWDFQTKQCLQVLEGHTKNVCTVVFHPTLPIILSGAEDGTLRVWHASTYRKEACLSHNMDRLWNIACRRQPNVVALAYDEGTLTVTVGKDKPICSMHGSKIVWAKGTDIFAGNVRLSEDQTLVDGEKVPLAMKEVGSCEIFPQSLSHHPNGRFISLCGDGQYLVLTAQALRNKSYGAAIDLVWATDGRYAVRDETNRISIFHQFELAQSFRPSFDVQEIIGGPLLCVRGDGFVCFYEWTSARFVRRIDVTAEAGVFWSASGTRLAIASASVFHTLRFDAASVAAAVAVNAPECEEGIECAFEAEEEVTESIQCGYWVEESFVFVTNTLRLQMMTVSQIETIAFIDGKSQQILGYVPETQRLYLIDGEFNVISYEVSLVFNKFQAAVIKQDDLMIAEALTNLPAKLHEKAAKFLHRQNYSELALNFAVEENQRFEILLALKRLGECVEILEKGFSNDSKSANDFKWNQIGESALSLGMFDIAKTSLRKSNDISNLFLLATSTGDKDLIDEVLGQALKSNNFNIAFSCLFLTMRPQKAVELLTDRNRHSCAALLARTFAPSKMNVAVDRWKDKLNILSAAEAARLAGGSTETSSSSAEIKMGGLADESAKALEKLFIERRDTKFPPTSVFETWKEFIDIDLCVEYQQLGEEGVKAALFDDEPEDESDEVEETASLVDVGAD